MNEMAIVLGFAHDYRVEEVIELGMGLQVEKHFYFPGASEKGGRDGVLLRIIPVRGTSWVGTFAFGNDIPKAVTGVYSCPDPDSLCVISKGEGYLVSATEPTLWQRIDIYPILDVRIMKDVELLLFSDHTKIAAYDPQGHRWTTKDLSWDGIEITDVTTEQVCGLGWDSPMQRDVEFMVDLQTGKHVGGSSPYA